MKKSDLLKLLEPYPDDMDVCIPAYEDGFVTVTDVEQYLLAPYTGADKYHGPLKDTASGVRSLVLV